VQSLDNVVFINSYPSIDLHGYDRETARVAVNDFIRDCIKQKHEVVVIVHGVGSGVVKEATHTALKRHKKVAEFKTFYYNPGCTIVRIIV